jgi:predicted N-acetyltransferase YhbS
MPDMLVNLLKIEPVEPLIAKLREEGVVIRRVNSFESSRIDAFIRGNCGDGWADEAQFGLKSHPVTLFVALLDGQPIGFAVYESTRRNFFGPTAVLEEHRGRGIGKALLLACLWGMREMGYAYGIIGGAGPKNYYAKTVGATIIPDSDPGIYVDRLR